MKRHTKIVFFAIAFCVMGIPLLYPQEKLYSTDDIQRLIKNDSLKVAQDIIAKNIARYKSQQKYDSLAKYIEFEGHFKLNNGNVKTSIARAKALSDYIIATNDPQLIHLSLKNLGNIYDNAGQSEKAYEVLLAAVAPASKINEPNNTTAASVQYSLGFYKGRIGDYPTAKIHYLKSLELLKKSKADDYVFYNQAYTSLGGILWQESKLDSAEYYFNEALIVLKKADSTDLKNKLFRPSLIKLNMSVLLNALGRNKEAIKISYEAMEDLQEFIAQTNDEFYTRQAKRFIYSILDNLASYHNTLGEYKRSEDIIAYSYIQKKKEFEEGDISIIISHIILAQAKLTNRDFEGADYHANCALEIYKNKKEDVGDTYWKASVYSVKGSVYEYLGKMELAKEFYEKGDKAFRSTSDGQFSKDYLDRVILLSNFYVKINENEKAIATAMEAYEYSHKGGLKNTLQEFIQLKNVADIYFSLKNYPEALKYSEKAIQFNSALNINKMSSSDSILVQARKPGALYINTAAQYYLSKEKNTKVLKQYLTKIDEALAILEQRRKIVNNHQDVSMMISANEDLFNFAKRLRLDLYEITKYEAYLDQIISLHESAIYNRIRSRLNLRENMAFKNVPTAILVREEQLKKALINSAENTDGAINSYISASKEWEDFLLKLQKEYPAYFKVRYETIQEPIKGLQEKIPSNTTIVRYLYIEDQLYAFIVSQSEKHLIKLKNDSLEEYLVQLNKDDFSIQKKSPLLFELYKTLWEPVKNQIKTKKIVIVPDRDLFNLSFEMLTPKPLSDFSQFSSNSLLADYDISYNFSLLLYKDQQKTVNYSKNYVGFVPEFNKDMKSNYQRGIKDSVNLDEAYLTLLPQPFSKNLVQEYAKEFDGDYYTNENASKTHFINNAKKHKILHIGTHAESNNISPELSRLVFAKKLEGKEAYDENSLYAYEIYNIDLSANLAILTACETGKPTYQAGEGAISLAHAFNYAGSESILTSLWSIDEVSSNQIVGYFYEFLQKGLSKDEALKKAKIKYLTSVEGRGAAPQYWAGLVLVGNTAPISLPNGLPFYLRWAIGIGLLSTFFVYIIRKNKTKKLSKV
ncbi:MAG TPA: CHAT domain-containing tetratricopeptide repeat protein [Edaphocola sp.]|nr:CHAT domain-containing tetratricopeptide repeat protein [Edaphocola sp.]